MTPLLGQVRDWLARRTSVGGDPASPPAMFVSGEAGVGKTALVEAALADAWFVLRAAATPWAPKPYGLLAPLLPSDTPPISGLTVADIRAAVLIHGGPAVVLLEDLHWADDASLDLLPGLVDALSADAVAVVATYRSDELPRDHHLRRVRAQLRHGKQLAEIALEPLDPAGVAMLVESVLGGPPSPDLLTAVAERTEGVPFFVEELLAALDQAGALVPQPGGVGLAIGRELPLPDTVRDAVLLRAASLPDTEGQSLAAAAVAGVEFTVDTVAAVTSRGWPDALDESGLLVVGDGPARRFRHALVQEAVYSDIPWSRRRSLHLAVARVLEDIGRPPVVVARHLLAGNDRDRARVALVAAADDHQAVHAYRDAARLLTAALDEWHEGTRAAARAGALDRLARCAELSGDHATAITSLRELIDQTGRPDPGLLARLAVQHELLGQWSPALAAREDAAAAYDDQGLPGDAAAERLAVAAHLRSAASFRSALDHLDAAEAGALAADRTDLLCRIRGLRGNTLVRQGRAAEGLPKVREALELALTQGLAGPAAEVYQRLADSLEHTGDYRAAGRAYDSAYEFCRLHEQDTAGQLCRACGTVVMFQSGRWDQALAASAEVLADPASIPHARGAASAIAGLVRAMRGRPRAARAALLDSRATALRIELVPCELLSSWGLALLDEQAGRDDRAVAGYRFVVERCRATEERHYSVPVLQHAVNLFARLGLRDDLGAATALLAEAGAGSEPAGAAVDFRLRAGRDRARRRRRGRGADPPAPGVGSARGSRRARG